MSPQIRQKSRRNSHQKSRRNARQKSKKDPGKKPEDDSDKKSDKNPTKNPSNTSQTTLFVGGIPKGYQLGHHTSKDFIKHFLWEKIPNAADIHVPIDRKGITKGIAYVELTPGVNAKDVLKQVKGLQMGDQRLKIDKSKRRDNGKPSGGSGFGSGNSGGGFGGGNYGGGFGGSNSFGGFGAGVSVGTGFGGGNSGGGGFRGRYDRVDGLKSELRSNPVKNIKIEESKSREDDKPFDGINLKRDQQQSSFSSYQNDKKQPTRPSAGHASDRSNGCYTENLRHAYRGVPVRYRPLDSSNEEEAELISLMKACA